MNIIRRIFNPTPEEEIEDLQKMLKLIDEQKKERGCATCKHCKHMGVNYPGFVEAEESECQAGLECDTVFFTVKNCEEWELIDTEEKIKGQIKNLEQKIQEEENAKMSNQSEMERIVICKYCNQLEFYGKMRWLSGKCCCRDCYRKDYEKNSGLVYAWDDLDGPRPTMAQYERQEKELDEL